MGTKLECIRSRCVGGEGVFELRVFLSIFFPPQKRGKRSESQHRSTIPLALSHLIHSGTLSPFCRCCPVALSASPSSLPVQNFLPIRKFVGRLSGIYAPYDTLQAMRGAGGLLIGRQFKIAKEQIQLLSSGTRHYFYPLPSCPKNSRQHFCSRKCPRQPRTSFEKCLRHLMNRLC